MLRFNVRIRVRTYCSSIELRSWDLLKLVIHRRLGCRIFVATSECSRGFSIPTLVEPFIIWFLRGGPSIVAQTWEGLAVLEILCQS